MKNYIYIILIFSSYQLLSQSDNKKTFNQIIDGISISLTTPNNYQSVNDPNDDFKDYTIFLISKNPTNNLIKLNQIPIPSNLENELKNDEKKHLEVFSSVIKNSSNVEIDLTSFKSLKINGKKFYRLDFNDGKFTHISFVTYYNRKMFILYFINKELEKEEMEELKTILNTFKLT